LRRAELIARRILPDACLGPRPNCSPFNRYKRCDHSTDSATDASLRFKEGDQTDMTHYARPPESADLLNPSTLSTRGRAVFRWLIVANCIAILCCAVWFRGWELGRIPGVNGDEAWYGVAAERILDRGCVSARTPTGNVLNPFFMAPQVALHSFLDPSFTVLRTPALVSGLVALVVNFFLCRRAFGLRVAYLTTLIHAVLPINIAYSRFAWDASQSLLFTLPAIYAAVLANQGQRNRWTMVGLFSLAAALVVHPTNIFVAPFWAIMSAVAWNDRVATLWRSPAARRIGIPLILLAGVLVIWPWLPRIAVNSGSARNYASFAEHFCGLFSGASVYEYIPGTLIPERYPTAAYCRTQIGLESLLIAVAGVVAWAFWKRIRSGGLTFDAWLVIAWMCSVISFFTVAGPTAIAPHFERYAICLVAPTVLVIARAFHWWMQPTTRFSIATAPLLLVLGWCMLATFKSQYFDEFNERGGQSHLTFRTAGAEPKQQAFQTIALEREPNAPVLIQTSEWWLYWPLRYVAYAHNDVLVELRSSDDPRPVDQMNFPDMETWIVEFVESETAWTLQKSYAALGADRTQIAKKAVIHDAGGRELLLLIRLSLK
jgi:4-amino-4-deoxy-L-arabinose transferase-like glycosyltransferase